MAQLAIPEHLRGLARQARKSGWVISREGRQAHLRWTSPAGEIVTTGSSLGGRRRSITYDRLKLRKAGLR